MGTESTFPFISLMLISMPVGALLMWLAPDAGKARAIALGTALVDLCLALFLLWRFDSAASGFQFVEQGDWIPSLNVQYLVGLDGISVLFVPLTILL
ncbi:MAG TPA: NADH-quinone oxidoreductase subunit M, partial [Gammaproteobacteria bacterium]|nr:NADH-quinone oxidoreductase subunit M [Gammaproteobacteria bacterium]